MSKKKKAQTFDGAAYSMWQVIDSANGYYELSNMYTAQLPSSITEPSMRDDLALASATNRILALELYLKAFLIAANVPVPMEHDLRNLFDALPEVDRKSIKAVYDEENLKVPQSQSAELCMYFYIGTSVGKDAEGQGQPKVRSDPSLTGLLVRNRGGFVLTRYLFQEASRHRVSVYVYEHLRLAILCRILCETLEGLLPASQPYKRHFQFLL